MSSSIGKRALVTSTVIAAFAGSGVVFAPSAEAATIGSSTLAEATKHLGAPYVYGATGKSRFDCSGLIYYSRFKDTNRSHHKWFNTAQTQYNHTTHISSSSRGKGDLVFFGSSNKNIYHVGILTSKNYMIAAPYPGKNVRQEYIGPNSWWARHAHIYSGRM